MSARCCRSFESLRDTYLLIANSEFSLRLLVLVGESFEFLDRLRLQDFDAELDVALGVLVAGLESLSAHVERREMVDRLNARIRWCHPAEQQESRSAPCPSPWHCLRRNVRSLKSRQYSTNIGDANIGKLYRRRTACRQ